MSLDPPGKRDQAVRVGLQRGTRPDPRNRRRFDLRPHRTVGMRQDDDVAHDQPADRSRSRPGDGRRRGHTHRGSGDAALEDGLCDPANRAVPAHDHRRQRRDRAAALELGSQANRQACRRAARAGRPPTARVPRPLPTPTVWRAASARRIRQGPGRGSAHPAHGRTIRSGRQDHAGAPAAGVHQHPALHAQNGGLRHARHRRGRDRGRPDLPLEDAGRDRSVRHAGKDPDPSGQRVRRRVPGQGKARPPDVGCAHQPANP